MSAKPVYIILFWFHLRDVHESIFVTRPEQLMITPPLTFSILLNFYFEMYSPVNTTCTRISRISFTQPDPNHGNLQQDCFLI